jgi:SAM-dependent methyltransferase/tetratricopeptide (TPR) repeat protein
MSTKSDSPLLLFYPTSPVHVRDIRLLMQKLPGWRCIAVVYRPFARVAPGTDAALNQHGISYVALDGNSGFEEKLPGDTSVLALGTVAQHFALDLFAWAKHCGLPVVAIEEVAQLALNHLDINNYDAPFDRLFVASPEERRLFLKLGYTSEMLWVSGLLANDRLGVTRAQPNGEILELLGIGYEKKAIVYSTAPVRSRLALHTKDDRSFREAVLAQIAEASGRTGRTSVIKLHPNENLENERERIQKIVPNAIVVGREMAMEDIFPVTGVLVNRGNSQTCLDGVSRGIPTVVVACGLKTLFHDDGGAYVVEEIGNLANTIETALTQGAPDSSRVRSNHFCLPPDGVADFIAREINAAAERTWPAAESSWNWLIRSMLFVGRHDRALALSERLKPASPWQEQVRAALTAHKEGRLQDVISDWLKCAAHDPNWFFPHYELAHGFLAYGDPEQAMDHARTAIELHPPYHSLWHELPMRVVIMASLRRQGNVMAASRELKALEGRGLVAVVPELLIEWAVQHCSFDDRLGESERCLENAVDQLKRYPVHQSADSHIMERAVRQYLDLVERYADIGDSAGSFACLAQAMDLTRSEAAIQDQICSHLGELGEKREKTGDCLLAEKFYISATGIKPNAHWSRYHISRLALKQGKPRKALGGLLTITRISGAPREIIEKILSPATATRLAPYWPQSPRSIVKPLALWLWVSGWFLWELVRSRFQDIHNSATAVILVWVFVVRHFVRRLRTELLNIRKISYSIRSFLSSVFFSHGHRVTNCPICGARGKYEYQNKLTPLFRCLQCNHVYARDLPSDEALNSLYGDFSYWEKDRYHQGITAIQESEEWHTYITARMGILQKLKLLDGPAQPTKRIFEIGCAEGMLLYELSKRGIEVRGCEMNRAVAEEGMKRLGVDILTTPFENIDLPENNFDLVMSFHTLEHLRYPVNVLAKVAKILHSDGAILLEVPCGEEEYENTDHLHFFSENSLRRLLDRFFVDTEILTNSYTNSAGVQIGSLYGVARGVRNRGN